MKLTSNLVKTKVNPLKQQTVKQIRKIFINTPHIKTNLILFTNNNLKSFTKTITTTTVLFRFFGKKTNLGTKNYLIPKNYNLNAIHRSKNLTL